MVDLPAPGGPATATIVRLDFAACLKMAAAMVAIVDRAISPDGPLKGVLPNFYSNSSKSG